MKGFVCSGAPAEIALPLPALSAPPSPAARKGDEGGLCVRVNLGPCEMYVCSPILPSVCPTRIIATPYRLGAAIRPGKRHNKDPRMEGRARQLLVAQEGSLFGIARIPRYKCPRWLVLGRWWTELEPAARGLVRLRWPGVRHMLGRGRG